MKILILISFIICSFISAVCSDEITLSEAQIDQAREIADLLLASNFASVAQLILAPDFDTKIVNYRRPEDGQTILHLAVQVDSLDIAFKMAKLPGVDLNVLDHKRRSPLHVAIIEGYDYCAIALINAGADIYLASDSGSSLLLAKLNGRDVILRHLKRRAASLRGIQPKGHSIERIPDSN